MDRQPLAEIDYTKAANISQKGCKRHNEHVTFASVSEVYSKPCCLNDCCSNFTVDEILRERDFYWSKNVNQQRAYIFSQLRNNISNQFAVCGKSLCENGWRKLYGIKTRRFYELKKRLKLRLGLPVKQSKMKTPSRVRLQARTWFKKYLRLHAERMPDREELHLPHCVSKDAIYRQYVQSMKTACETLFSQSSFNDMWLQEFQHVKIAKGKNGQPKCTPCTNIAVALSMNLSKNERTMIEEKRTVHFNLQGECRSKYYKHIKKAKENPAAYVSVIIDNMDQAKTRLPNFAMYSKVEAHLNKMQHHVTGIKVHNLEKTFILTWTDMFHPDCNVTINALVYVLHKVSQDNDGNMPPTLYLQADNSGKDNKNSFVMVFLAWLVKQKIFRKVKLSFLMVGHTHEDIDQVFSRISTHQSRVDAPTLFHLHRGIEQSTTPSPIVNHLTGLHDYKEKLEQARGAIEGISSPHQFVFKEQENRVVLTYKNWPLATEEGRTLDLTDLLPNLDVVQAVALNPKISTEINKMKADLSKWNGSGRLSEDEMKWWVQYLAEQEVVIPDVPLASALPKYKEPERLQQDIAHLQKAILQNSEKDGKITQLKLKKRRKNGNS